jgi:hypothetical protein
MNQTYNRRWLYLGVVLSVTILLFTTYNFVNQRGANSRDEVIKTYLRALRNRDESLMLQLVPKSYLGEQAVQDKIAQLGGHDISELLLCYFEFKPFITFVTIQGSYIGSNSERKRFEDKVNLHYEPGSFLVSYRGRWYLALGKPNISRRLS